MVDVEGLLADTVRAASADRLLELKEAWEGHHRAEPPPPQLVRRPRPPP